MSRKGHQMEENSTVSTDRKLLDIDQYGWCDVTIGNETFPCSYVMNPVLEIADMLESWLDGTERDYWSFDAEGEMYDVELVDGKMRVVDTGRSEPMTPTAELFEQDRWLRIRDLNENVIETINEIRRPEQQLIVVCGCGGDRDRTKRPEMGAIASREASVAVFTSDNPRTEDPEAILDQIMEGVAAGSRCLRITDRAQAIRTAVMLSHEGDIILIAGKGHETYQIVGRERHHFDDREQAAEALRLVEEVK